MRTPKAEKEDPAVVAAREREERRAEASRTEETQGYLMGATVRRLRRFGRLAGGSGGSVPMTGGTNTVGSVSGGGGSSGGFSGSGGGGSGGGGFGGVQQRDVALY